jgi:penicillin-binding protein 1A
LRPFRKKPARPKRHRIRKLRLAAVLAVVWMLASAAFTFGLIRAIAAEVPELDPARQEAREINGYIYDSNARSPRVLAVLRGSESRVLVRSEDIAPIAKQAIVAIEDRRFWEHSGVDIRGIGRALWADVRSRDVREGGSTITQQYVKNAYLHNERSIARKVREAALAWQLTQQWSKDKILTEYLNTIYFGNGAYGIQQAALTYFGKGARELKLHEAALLAGIPRDPSLYDPVVNPDAAKGRRRSVLRSMLEQHDITQAQYAEAAFAPLPQPEDVRLPGTQGPAQYFVNYVKGQLIQKYGSTKVFGGGLRVRTTIDLRLQELAREAISKRLTDPDGPSAALVAIDPRDGSIKAMVGGNNYRKSQFNLAVQAQRQPGSAFKPFVLAEALRQGISPATHFVSEPQLIDLGDKHWPVANYEDSYLGNIDLETATVHSDNAVYAQLTQLVGSTNVARMARQLGVRTKLTGYYAIGLGAEAVNPLEMAHAYATFANGGRRIDGSLIRNEPRAIVEVDEEGKPPAPNARVVHEVLGSAQTAWVNTILQQVVADGTGQRAALKDRVAAGKTGTTENYGDAWFVGYTPQLAVAVWVGYPEGLKPMLTEYHGRAVSGATFPAEIWQTFTQSALEALGEEPESFPLPPSVYVEPKLIVRRNNRLWLDNGYCEVKREVVYFSGSGPSRKAGCKPNEVEVPNVIGQTQQDAEARLAAQPLEAELVYKPAEPRQQPWLVVDQRPRKGFLSSYDRVIVVVSKPVHGLVPDLVGKPLAEAQRRLKQRKLGGIVQPTGTGTPGTVVSQSPAAGLAAAPGMKITLVVARG